MSQEMYLYVSMFPKEHTDGSYAFCHGSFYFCVLEIFNLHRSSLLSDCVVFHMYCNICTLFSNSLAFRLFACNYQKWLFVSLIFFCREIQNVDLQHRNNVCVYFRMSVMLSCPSERSHWCIFLLCLQMPFILSFC